MDSIINKLDTFENKKDKLKKNKKQMIQCLILAMKNWL